MNPGLRLRVDRGKADKQRTQADHEADNRQRRRISPSGGGLLERGVHRRSSRRQVRSYGGACRTRLHATCMSVYYHWSCSPNSTTNHRPGKVPVPDNNVDSPSHWPSSPFWHGGGGHGRWRLGNAVPGTQSSASSIIIDHHAASASGVEILWKRPLGVVRLLVPRSILGEPAGEGPENSTKQVALVNHQTHKPMLVICAAPRSLFRAPISPAETPPTTKTTTISTFSPGCGPRPI